MPIDNAHRFLIRQQFGKTAQSPLIKKLYRSLLSVLKYRHCARDKVVAEEKDKERAKVCESSTTWTRRSRRSS